LKETDLLAFSKKWEARFLPMPAARVSDSGTREGSNKGEKNTIVHSFNRNFSKRADGNPNTHAFVTSPEIVTALAIAGRLDFNPLTDTLTNSNGEQIKLNPPTGEELPSKGFAVEDAGYQAPAEMAPVFRFQ
jgi:aconitate hydratase